MDDCEKAYNDYLTDIGTDIPDVYDYYRDLRFFSLETLKDIGLDVLTLKIKEERTFNFKDEPITIKRVK